MPHTESAKKVIQTILITLIITSIITLNTAEVRAQTTPPYISVGIPVNLTLTAIVEPNDTIAPHLYVWYFDGADDYIKVPRSSSLEPSQLTVAVWVNMNSLISSDWGPMIVSKYDGRYRGYTLFLFSTSGRPTFQIATPNVLYTALSPDAINVNNWYFITGVWDGNNIYIYVNSVLKRSARAPAITHNADLYIGREGWANLGYVNGFIREVFIFSRALSDSEIYNAYAYNIINASGLVLFLDPTFYNGTHFLDLSGYNNHGVGYNNVSRVPDQRQWLYLVKNHSSDGLVHFRFFPVNSRVEIYDTNNNLVTSFLINGSVNAVGLVEDYAVSLISGNYTVKVYTYLDMRVFQNNGLTYYSYIARYSPNSSIRIMWNNTNAVAIDYQLSTDPTFSIVNYENIVGVSANYYDLTLPSTNNTWYLRVRLQFPDGSWSGWSNAVSFRTDYLVMTTSTSRVRADLSTGINITYSITYSDGSPPPVINVNVTAVLTQLGVYRPTDVWWRVDVYSGATTSAEPPNPTYYTYKGTAYPISTHSFFAYTLSYIPSGYDSTYIYAGVDRDDAPYWVKSVGGPSTYYALVYQSMVYLPLSGSYTFELVSDKGARLYVNNSLVIDGWSGAGTRSTTITLNTGWYNITVKFWQTSTTSRLLLGVTLPNGTVVKPLRPAYGILMSPPDTSYSATLPSTPLTLFINYTLGSTTATIPSVGLGVSGQAVMTFQSYDVGTWFTSNVTVVLTWDKVIINSITPARPRFTVGDTASFNITAVYAYDNTSFNGTFTFNDTLVKSVVGLYTYSVASITDNLYGLTRFEGNTTVSVVFDKLVIDSWFVNAVNKSGSEVLINNNSRVDYTSVIKPYVKLKHAYDGLEVTSGTVSLFNTPATYVNGYWVATVNTTAVGMKTYPVLTSAQSNVTTVRFVDTPPNFAVVWDALNVTYVSTDPVSEVGTVKLIYATDGVVANGVVGFIGANTTTVNTVNYLANVSIWSLDMNVTLPHTAYGVVDVNGLVWTPYQNASVPIYKLVFDRIRVKADNPITILGYTNISGQFIHVKYDVKGNTAINITATAVLVNGRPYPITLRDGHTVLYGLSSTVDIYSTQPSSVVATSYASAPGFDVEVGLTDNNTIDSATLKAGVLMNSTTFKSTVFVWYNGSVVSSKDMVFPSPPTDVLVSYYCESNTTLVVYVGLVYMSGNYTRMDTAYVKGSVPACPTSLYPYVYAPTTSIFVERYGSTLGMLFRLLVVGDLKVSIVGPVIPGSLLKYVYVSSPLAIEYVLTDINVYPYGTKGVTLKGFRGWSLSYSVSGVTISGVSITSDAYVVDVPVGITLVVSVDPVGRSVSIVSASPPPVVTAVPAPTVTPTINLPDVSVLKLSIPQTASLLMYGVFLALTVAIYSVTRSLSTAIVVSGVVSSIYAFATKDLSILPYTAVAITLGIALYVASRE
jgi:hypothetical protein